MLQKYLLLKIITFFTFIVISSHYVKAQDTTQDYSNELDIGDIEDIFLDIPSENIEDDSINHPINDSLEPLNRVFFEVNVFLDRALLRPPANVYERYVPYIVKKPLSHFFDHWSSEPTYLINYAFQFDGQKFKNQLFRFGINSTLGLAGFIDMAKNYGYHAEPTDFGLTFAKWGVPQGDYIMLPVLGPQTYRSALGTIPNMVFNPFTTWLSARNANVSLAYSTTNFVTKRAKLLRISDDIEKNSVDVYSAVRSFYAQNRRQKISVIINESE